jgi:ATP-dependent exoDNAse (exonuclease V) beta subunit
LVDSAAVLAVLALLTVADHPGDSIARFHVVSSPLGRVVGLRDWSDEAAADRVAQQVRQQLVVSGYGATIRGWVDRLLEYAAPRDQSRLRQLADLAYDYQPFASLRPDDFIRFVATRRVADPSTADVRVMTIHQAKGLQFDIVVLSELEVGLIGQAAPYVVRQEDPTRPVDRVCLYRNASIQALLPADLQDMFAQATHQEVTENLSVMYVALTRAIHALHMVIAPSRANERQLPRTIAGLLRTTLTDAQPLPPESVVYACGDAEWFRRLPVLQHQPRPSQRGAEPIVFAAPTGRLRRTAPSQLEGGGTLALSDVFRLDKAAARARGSMMHAWFEKIEWLDDGRPSPDALRRVAADIAAQDLDVDDLLRQFNALLDCPTIAKVLRRDSYRDKAPYAVAHLRLEVHNERRFAVRDEQRLLSGTIDRLVLIKEADRVIGADVIDFKTDAVPADDPGQLDAAVEYYRPQQEAYRSAVSKMFHLDPERVSTRLLLLGPKIVREV